MGFFAKSSLAFICSNGIRFLTVIAICLTIAGNMVLMVKNIQSFQHQPNPSTDLSTSSSVSISTPIATSTISSVAVPTTSATSNKTSTEKIVEERASILETTSNVEVGDSSSCAVTVGDAQTNDFVSGTDVPTSPGAVAFLTLTFIFQVIMLFFLLLAEIPPPPFQRLLEAIFPPLFFSPTLSMLMPGLFYLYLSSSLLSHSDLGITFVTVAGWFLFVLGSINIIFLGGIAWMAGIDVRLMRSIFGNVSKAQMYSPRPPSSRAASSKYAESDLEANVGRPPMTYSGEKPSSITIGRPTPQFNMNGDSEVEGFERIEVRSNTGALPEYNPNSTQNY